MMEFHKLGKKERALLLDLLGVDKDNLACLMCGEKTSFESCSILPKMIGKGNADILCDSILCFSEWLTNTEELK